MTTSQAADWPVTRLVVATVPVELSRELPLTSLLPRDEPITWLRRGEGAWDAWPTAHFAEALWDESWAQPWNLRFGQYANTVRGPLSDPAREGWVLGVDAAFGAEMEPRPIPCVPN